MGVFEIAAIANKPQEYYGAISECLIEHSEETFGYEADSAFSYDRDQLEEMGFNRGDLIEYVKKMHELGAKRSILTSLAKVYTVSIPISIAIENDYIPDGVMEEDGHITLDDGRCEWKEEYRRILGMYENDYIVVLNVHC